MSPSSGPKIVALAPNAPEPARLRAKFDSVGRKLALGFAIVVSLLLLLTITAYVGLIGAQRSEALIVEHNVANLQGILQLRANLEAERLDVLLLFEASPTDRAPRLADLRLRTVADRTIVAGVQSRLRSDPAAKPIVDELVAVRAEFERVRTDTLLPMIEAGRMAEARALYFGAQMARHQRLRALAQQLETREQQAAEQAVASSRDKARTFLVLFSLLGGCSLAGGVALGFGLRRTFATHVAERSRAELELRHSNRALLTIRSCQQALVRATDERQLMQEICHAIVTVGGYRLAWVGFAERDADKTVRAVASAGFEEGYLAAARITWADTERGRGPTGTAIRTGQPVVCRDMTNDPRFAPWRAQAIQRGYRSSVVLPVLLGGISSGALSIYAVEPDAFDEAEVKLLAALADDLSYGIDALRLREERSKMAIALQRSEERLRSMIENVRDYAIVWLEPNGRIASWNLGAERIKGYRADEILGQNFSAFYTPEDIAAGKPQLELEIAGTSGRFEDEHWRVRKDGSRFWANVVLTAIRGPGGRLDGFVKITRDLSERKAAEDRIKAQTDELQRSNRELEHFAYVASHDLQEPLRTVSSFSQLLAARYRTRLDQDADDFIDFIVGGATRMQTLINDLLAFSRVGTRGQPFAPVDGETVLATVLSNLEATMADANANVTHDPLPTVCADETQLGQLLQNLLGNAIKFRRRDVPPHIHVTANRVGSAWQFTVSDNGIGIEPQYFERIFIIFQRLHGRDEYPGTGIGLAICRKIVERHGGRIWVESQPGSGSAFHFTLPDPVSS